MKHISNLKVWLLSCLVALGFAACDNDNLDTQQYKGGVSLNVYGPQPVMRGGTLRFLGSNLDQVTQVIIPGVEPITDIEVRQSGAHSEILVQVPVDGPEVGYVTLVTANGAEIVTQTQLTYEEPIVFEGFSPATAMPGEVITITGDYLNLIHEVIFADEVAVPEAEFISHSRYQIEVVVPDAAQTGQIILSDGVEDLPNWIYSETELEVGVPTVTSFIATRFKAGETLNITGTALNLVDYVRFNASAEVPYDVPSAALAGEGEAFFTLNEEGTQITLAQPVEAASGAVELVLRSGLTVQAIMADVFQVVVPSDLAVSPQPVKAGASLTITGTDLDLVTSIAFPTNTEGTTVDGGAFSMESGKLVLAAVPATAVEGNVLLNMANGMNATVPYVLVKPSVTSYSANQVNAGASLVLTGTNLDLVTGVSFGGGSIAVPEEGATATSLTVVLPMDSKSGAVSLALENGTTVEAPSLEVAEAVFCFIATMPEGEVTAGSVCSVEVGNGDKLEKVEVDGTSVQFLVNNGILQFNVPTTAGAGSKVKLISSNGEVEYDFPFVPLTKPEIEIWSGNFALGAWANGMQDLAWGGYDFSNIEAGTIINVYFTTDASATLWQLKLGRGSNWDTLPDFKTYAGGADAVDVSVEDTVFSYSLGAKDVEEILNNNGLIFQGANLTLTKVTLIY